jgi:hypothetical protein
VFPAGRHWIQAPPNLEPPVQEAYSFLSVMLAAIPWRTKILPPVVAGGVFEAKSPMTVLSSFAAMVSSQAKL